MNFFKTKKLYRVIIIKQCPVISFLSATTIRYLPTPEVARKASIGFIPVGTKGWVLEKYNKKYFMPDENQEDIELYTPAAQPISLIPYKKIEGYYQIITNP